MSGFEAKKAKSPFVDPSLGVDQFFDPDGPGPTSVDRATYDAAVGNKVFKTGLPALDKRLAEKNSFSTKFREGAFAFADMFSVKPITDGLSSAGSFLKSTLILVIVVILVAVFTLFALKNLAQKVAA